MQSIKVNNVSKSFTFYKKEEGFMNSLKSLVKREKQTKHAVKSISFEIEQGEFVGFLGPNGAGKSTTLKMLTGILYPTEGDIEVMGHNPSDRENDFKRKISIVMGQKAQLWMELPAIESLTLLAKMYCIPESTYRKRLKYLTKLMNIDDVLDIQVRRLSLGQKMKAELVAALIHEPDILFLDEPTIGLDVVSQKEIRKFLKEYNKKNGTTIILTSHYMDDVQDLCKRLIIINEGEIGYDDSLEKIMNQYSKDKIVGLKFEKKVFKKDLKPFGKIIESSDFEATLSIKQEKSQDAISSLIKKLPVSDININDVTLEEVITDIFS